MKRDIPSSTSILSLIMMIVVPLAAILLGLGGVHRNVGRQCRCAAHGGARGGGERLADGRPACRLNGGPNKICPEVRTLRR